MRGGKLAADRRRGGTSSATTAGGVSGGRSSAWRAITGPFRPRLGITYRDPAHASPVDRGAGGRGPRQAALGVGDQPQRDEHASAGGGRASGLGVDVQQHVLAGGAQLAAVWG